MQSSLAAPQLAIGELLWDMLPSGPRLGGATTNFAVLSARLGEYSTLASSVGADEPGRDALSRLKALSQNDEHAYLDLSHVETSPSLPTGTVSVTLDQWGGPKYVINEPVAWDEISLTPALIETARSAPVIYFGTLVQRNELSQTCVRAVIEASGPSCTRICDLNLRSPFCFEEVVRWSLAHADILKVSDEELSEVGRLMGDPLIEQGLTLATNSATSLTEEASACAAALLKIAPQCKLVAITLGPHGSLLMDRAGSFRHEGYAVNVVDTIGAGDAFTAGLVHAYRKGATLKGISSVSNLCGSHVASNAGATPEIPDALRAKISSVLESGDLT